ncbi:hypothetical protein [Halorubrum lipolyticum]|nr:hypothetical protein [Halorubrum lipolyticum]
MQRLDDLLGDVVRPECDRTTAGRGCRIPDRQRTVSPRYRLWRRREGDLAPATEKTQIDAIRVFVMWLEGIDAVVDDLHTKVRSPVLRDVQNVRDVMLESDRAEESLEYLSKYEYASRPHVVLTLMWHTMMRTGTVHSLDADDCDPDGRYIGVVHRPETGTTIKNGSVENG